MRIKQTRIDLTLIDKYFFSKCVMTSEKMVKFHLRKWKRNDELSRGLGP